MRKMYVWMQAAIRPLVLTMVLSCGASVLTSCGKDDDNSTVVQPAAKDHGEHQWSDGGIHPHFKFSHCYNHFRSYCCKVSQFLLNSQ